MKQISWIGDAANEYLPSTSCVRLPEPRKTLFEMIIGGTEMRSLFFAALGLAVFTTSSLAQDPVTGVFLCTVTDKQGDSGKIGDPRLIGVNEYASSIIFLYESGSGRQMSCEVTARVFTCHFGTIARNATFDANAMVLTEPWGFEKDYTRSKCERFHMQGD